MNQNNRPLYLFSFIILLGLCLIQLKKSKDFPKITENEIMSHIRYLSHESRGGRYPGTKGSKDVIAYLVKEFKSYGIKPGINKSFVQPFDITTDLEIDKSSFATLNNDTLKLGDEYTPLSFSSDGNATGALVFVGYGFNINEEKLKWNDYKNIDVKNKWAIIMRHGPSRDEKHSKYANHMPLHKKMLVARDMGAVGVAFISQVEDENILPFNYMPGYKNEGIPAIHFSNEFADKILKQEGWSRRKIQEEMNQKLNSISFEIDNQKLTTKIKINKLKIRAGNVVGEIRSGNRKHRDEYIVIGAHFDHLGLGGHGSGSRKPKDVLVHPGANDNASGTAGLLEIAQKLSTQKGRLKRSVLLVGFDAEEKGLLGAKHFIKNPPIDLDKIITMINLDMIGGMKDSTVTVGGVGTSPSFEPLLDSLEKSRNIKISMSKPGFGPSDHAAFYSENIPVLFFFSGFDNEYHTPNDTWKNINLKGTESIVNLVYDVVFHVNRTSSPPVFTESGPKQAQTPAPKRFNVTLGIMPSYGSIEAGLEIDAISRVDGPAAVAGIKPGDIITSINGKGINDIYEYMDRLGELKPGMTVPVVVIREGKELVFRVSF